MAIAGAAAARALKSKGAKPGASASPKTKGAYTRMSKVRGGFKKK